MHILLRIITWDNKETKQTLKKTTLQADGNLGLTAEGKIPTLAQATVMRSKKV